jgi:hypothetical protein
VARPADIHTFYGLRKSKGKFKMAIMIAYFDESGIHDDDLRENHCCVVAGYVGNSEQWHALAAEWIPAIRPRKNLHMKELRWKKHPERIGLLLARLGPIPEKYNLQPVQVWVRWCDYKTVFNQSADPFMAPYVLCANLSIVTCLLDFLPSDDSIYFIFDRQEGLRRETMQKVRDIVYDWLGADRRVEGIDFISRHTNVCLDPADYLAFMSHEQALDPGSQKVKLGCSIFDGRPSIGGKLSLAQLRWLADEGIRKAKDKFPAEEIRNLMKFPHFRGPKSRAE